MSGSVLSAGRLFASGYSSNIHIYTASGPIFQLEQIIQTSESRIYETSISENGTKILFGGQSGYASTYQKINGSYSFSEELYVGKAVSEVYLDEKELYLMIETADEMLTYYRCPP